MDQETYERLVNLLADGHADESRRLVGEVWDREPANREGVAGLVAQGAIHAGDDDLLEMAAERLRELVDADPGSSTSWYNLGNVLIAHSLIDGCADPDTFLALTEVRRDARRAFEKAASLADTLNATQACVNLANSLSVTGRWAEAYETYGDALAIEPRNGMAAGNAAVVLLGRARRAPRHGAHLRGLAAQYARVERANRDLTLAFGGPDAATLFDRLPVDGDALHDTTDLRDPYGSWVAANRLHLALTVEHLPSATSWDEIHIDRLTQPIDSSDNVPPIFAMVNILKQDFLFARELAFDALETDVPGDGGMYAQTLDGAIYGRRPAMLTAAQRLAFDILDRIAVATASYLASAANPTSIHYRTYWTHGGNPRRWRDEVKTVLLDGSRSLLALCDLAFDLDTHGYLAPHRTARNDSTHRFVILHETLDGGFDDHAAIEHRDFGAYATRLIDTLHITRAAILYFVDFVREREAPTSGVAVPLRVALRHDETSH
jgi:tetratricopeptide (TPR) repeat protein